MKRLKTILHKYSTPVPKAVSHSALMAALGCSYIFLVAPTMQFVEQANLLRNSLQISDTLWDMPAANTFKVANPKEVYTFSLQLIDAQVTEMQNANHGAATLNAAQVRYFITEENGQVSSVARDPVSNIIGTNPDLVTYAKLSGNSLKNPVSQEVFKEALDTTILPSNNGGLIKMKSALYDINPGNPPLVLAITPKQRVEAAKANFAQKRATLKPDATDQEKLSLLMIADQQKQAALDWKREAESTVQELRTKRDTTKARLLEVERELFQALKQYESQQSSNPFGASLLGQLILDEMDWSFSSASSEVYSAGKSYEAPRNDDFYSNSSDEEVVTVSTDEPSIFVKTEDNFLSLSSASTNSSNSSVSNAGSSVSESSVDSSISSSLESSSESSSTIVEEEDLEALDAEREELAEELDATEEALESAEEELTDAETAVEEAETVVEDTEEEIDEEVVAHFRESGTGEAPGGGSEEGGSEEGSGEEEEELPPVGSGYHCSGGDCDPCSICLSSGDFSSCSEACS